MKKLSPATLVAYALAAAALALFAYAQFFSTSPSRDPGKLRAAVEAAARYISVTELRGDDAWVATQGAMQLGPTFRIWAETIDVSSGVATDLERDPLEGASGRGVEGHLWNLRWIEPIALPPLDPPAIPSLVPVSTTLSDEDILALIRIMAQAVACHRLGAADLQAWVDELRRETSGYLLTHQLIALLLGRHQGCIDAETAEPIRADLTRRLFLEQSMDRRGIDDLSLERLAILCFAQVCDWLQDEWIDEVIRTQQPSGSWGAETNAHVNERVIAREEHSAALGFYVLASVWQQRFADEAPPRVPPRN